MVMHEDLQKLNLCSLQLALMYLAMGFEKDEFIRALGTSWDIVVSHNDIEETIENLVQRAISKQLSPEGESF